MDILLRKHRIILPLHCSASASPAWRCNIIALQSCWLLQCLGTLASQSKLDFCSRRGTQMSIMKGKAKTGWNVFRVFLPFPVLFLCSSGTLVVWKGKRWLRVIIIDLRPRVPGAPQITEILLPPCGHPDFAHDFLCSGGTIVKHQGKESIFWDGEKRSSCKTTQMDVPSVKS